MTASRGDVVAVFARYAAGERAEGRGAPRAWYVRDPDTLIGYPAKHIWGLASGDVRFDATTAVKRLRGLGFDCGQVEFGTGD